MRRVLLILLVAAACNEITGDFSDVIAIEYAGPSSLRIEEGDTVRLEALALDLRGQPLPDVQVVWTVIELDTVQVGFTLDSLTGLITATAPGGPWRVQGRVEELRTDPPIRVTVTPSPDSMAVVEPSRIVVDSGVSQSAGLVTIVYDLTTTPDQLTPLPGVAVRYELVDPAPGGRGGRQRGLGRHQRGGCRSPSCSGGHRQRRTGECLCPAYRSRTTRQHHGGRGRPDRRRRYRTRNPRAFRRRVREQLGNPRVGGIR